MHKPTGRSTILTPAEGRGGGAQEKTPRKPEYGEVRWNVGVYNQHGEQVAGYDLLTMNAV